MFSELMNNIWDEFARYVFNVEVEVEGQDGGGRRQQPADAPQWTFGANSSSTGALSYAGGTAADQPSALAAARTAGGAAAPNVAPGGGMMDAAQLAADAAAELPAPVETRRLADDEKVGRNDPCPCGSGKKYKKCHGA
jgi:preprotein translocase subunit SecA